MITTLIIIFFLGYLCIAFEHPIKIDKAATAIVTGVICWTILVLCADSGYYQISKELQYHLVHISEILFFLLGAMTIVELVDSHQGFSIITNKIKTSDRIKLLWIISILSFFFSAVLDNLTTAIVMAALLPKIIKGKDDIWFFGGMVILACNAGGAWSPIGDVTTIMLWIGGQVSALNIITSIFIPSLICMLAPLIYLSFTLKGKIIRPKNHNSVENQLNLTTSFERNLVFSLGVAGLLFVPVFKTVTHLPPYMGMLLSLGVLWVVTEVLHRSKNLEEKSNLTVIGVLKKVETPTIFFFLGILLAVSCLQSAGILNSLANYLNNTIGNIYVINVIVGLMSAIVDNVPLVAAAMGMYPIDSVGPFAQDGTFWEFLAYCAGTGGSVLIIGSAAGVAVMGILKIDFMWYLKKISFLAFIGYIYGALAYIILQFL
ncbi:MAG: sodium:proton antiporter [Flavobacteriales bacterium TMED191]|nr:MAG: sodium:proton antiporter [Flavobacteriales bacterium TMED191]